MKVVIFMLACYGTKQILQKYLIRQKKKENKEALWKCSVQVIGNQ